MTRDEAVGYEVFEPELSLLLCDESLHGIVINQLLTLEAWTTEGLAVLIGDDLGSQVLAPAQVAKLVPTS